jgi:hypothetical protein
MERIKEIKAEIRHSEWAEQIQECQNSGMTVTRWCQENNIRASTYYNRLKIVRDELIAKQLKQQSIVPVSVSAEIFSQQNNQVESALTQECGAEKIVLRKNGIEAEMPVNGIRQPPPQLEQNKKTW